MKFQGWVLIYKGYEPPVLYRAEFKALNSGKRAFFTDSTQTAVCGIDNDGMPDRLYALEEVFRAEAQAVRAYLTAVGNWRTKMRDLIHQTEQEDVKIIHRMKGFK